MKNKKMLEVIETIKSQLGHIPTNEEVVELCNKPSVLQKHIKNKDKITRELAILEDEHNWSLFDELYYRNKENLDNIAIQYRGRNITYRQMFDNAIAFAKTLGSIGIEKGEPIPACLDNTPEFIYSVLGANYYGAKINLFGSKFDKAYIEAILASCSKKIIICADNFYDDIKDIVSKFNYDNKVLISLKDSLPKDKNGASFDPYDEFDKHFLKFEDRIPAFQATDNSLQRYADLVDRAVNYTGVYHHPVGINDEFTITYTSGSTKIGLPKQIIHKNKNYIVSARFHDSDLSNLPPMRNISGLALAPTHSNTQLSANITDLFSQGCRVDLEPIYSEDFFLYSLFINKTNFASATTSYWIKAAKMVESIPELRNILLPYLGIPTASGEKASKGEEKYINKFLKRVEAGRNVLPKPISYSRLSMGGGDTEHGGYLFTLFRSLKAKLQPFEEYGMDIFQLANAAVLDESGREKDYNEWGYLVTNSAGMMSKYRDNEEANAKFFIKDAYGRKWGNCNLGAKINKKGQVIIGGRLGNEIYSNNGRKIAEFELALPVQKDTKNILSAETAFLFPDPTNRENPIIVIHIEKQPTSKKNLQSIIAGAYARLEKEFDQDIIDKIVFRIRSYEEGYPLTKSGKRSVRELELEGISQIDKCYTKENNQIICLTDKDALKLNK